MRCFHKYVNTCLVTSWCVILASLKERSERCKWHIFPICFCKFAPIILPSSSRPRPQTTTQNDLRDVLSFYSAISKYLYLCQLSIYPPTPKPHNSSKLRLPSLTPTSFSSSTSNIFNSNFPLPAAAAALTENLSWTLPTTFSDQCNSHLQ